MFKFFTTLRSRLILITILTAVPGIFLLIQAGLKQRDQAIQDTQAEIIHLAKVASSVERLMVDNAKSFLLTIAHLPTIREQRYDECNFIFWHMFEDHFEYYSAFYVADLEGNIVCSPPEKHAPPDFESCDHYQSLIKATDFTISGYHICRVTGKAVMSVGYPVYDMQDQFTNVANVSLDLIWFYDFAQSAGLPEGGELIVMDEYGIILEDIKDPGVVPIIVDKIMGSIDKPIQLFDELIKTDLSIGWNLSSQDGYNAEEVFSKAEIAMRTDQLHKSLHQKT